MIGLDTNVIVRHLTQDDPVQGPRASAAIAQLSARNPGFISVVTMAELAWVLERAYRFPARRIAAAIEHLLAADALVVEQAGAVFSALALLEEGRGAFADALIGALSKAAGCTAVLTFDAAAARLPGFRLL